MVKTATRLFNTVSSSGLSYVIASVPCGRTVCVTCWSHDISHACHVTKRRAKTLQPPTCHLPWSGIRWSSKHARDKEWGGQSNSSGSTIGDPCSLPSTLPPVSFARGWRKVLKFKRGLRDFERDRPIGQSIYPFGAKFRELWRGVRLKPLCPTPWTIRTKAFSAVPVDYVVLQQTMEDISNTTHEPS